jgi:hypothetical protein
MTQNSSSFSDDKFNRYLFEYRHDGSEWGIEIQARSQREALDRIKALTWARYKGEIVAKVPVPGAGLIGRIIRALSLK